MSEPPLVNVLGMIAGAVWMSAALYFQLIRERRVHPAFVSALFLIGVALMMASSAVAVDGRPSIVELLAVTANGLFIGLGFAAWYAIEKYTTLQETKSLAEDGLEI
jgi:drug/metabolite transporter (DMT)-like permease